MHLRSAGEGPKEGGGESRPPPEGQRGQHGGEDHGEDYAQRGGDEAQGQEEAGPAIKTKKAAGKREREEPAADASGTAAADADAGGEPKKKKKKKKLAELNGVAAPSGGAGGKPGLLPAKVDHNGVDLKQPQLPPPPPYHPRHSDGMHHQLPGPPPLPLPPYQLRTGGFPGQQQQTYRPGNGDDMPAWKRGGREFDEELMRVMLGIAKLVEPLTDKNGNFPYHLFSSA
uniref:Uncharacterized protein n=1 Tax=Oryza brachyantha TaxID=4533 RepID=J3M401_ORYBR